LQCMRTRHWDSFLVADLYTLHSDINDMHQ
jgi:hypothetical protein